MVLRHPYHEDCVVLPTRTTAQPDYKSIAREVVCRTQSDDSSLSRWSPASWLNTLLEKHAWLSAGLVLVQGASMSASRGVFDESHSDESESRPTINLFEQWEEGAHMPKLVNARDYLFPRSLVVPFAWIYAPKALTLSDAINYVSQHEERDARGQASQINLVPGTNYPNQPERNPSSHLSDPLTYWWGVTLCPPELNDVSLAEDVVILMRYAAIKEINLNTGRGVRVSGSEDGVCSRVNSTPRGSHLLLSILEGGKVMQQFEEDDPMGSQATGAQHGVSYPVRSEGHYVVPMIPWPRIPEKEERDIAGVQKRKPYVHRRQGNRWDQYGESSSATSSEAHITSDPMNSESNWVHGSQPAEISGQLNHIDFRRPIRIMANGPDGPAISDSRSRISGVVILPDGIRLPATNAHGKECQIGKDQSGLHQLEGPW